MTPEVQEYINQDTTVVDIPEPTDDSEIPTEFRTPPGIPSGLDPGTLGDKDVPPRAGS